MYCPQCDLQMSRYKEQTAQQLHELGVFAGTCVDDFDYCLVIAMSEHVLLPPYLAPYDASYDDWHKLLYRY